MRSVRCTGEVPVAQPPEVAILQFTAEGERVWVPGWEPTYPAGDADSAGTVFLTSAHGREATSDEAAAELERFEADYPAMMAEWERGIAAQLP
jgi:hypothetical protein